MGRTPFDEERREMVISRVVELLEPEEDVQLAYLHGSAAREGSSHVGDLDVAVLLGGTPTPDEALDRELALEGKLARDVDIPVDLRVLNHAPLTFRFSVIRERGPILCRSRRAKDAFETTTLMLYHDFRPRLEEYRRESLGLGV